MRPDTIVALSSPPGRSPRALIRLAGPDAFSILQQLVLTPPPAADARAGPFELPPPRISCSAYFAPPLPPLPVLVLTFQGPASYTADDTAEVQLPGNPSLIDRVITRCLNLGARQARGGEFTYRAFLAGKLTLLQAQGVAATIAAANTAQLTAAHELLHDTTGRTLHALIHQLTTCTALVEAGIDFTDQEDVVPIPPRALHDQVLALRTAIRNLQHHTPRPHLHPGLPRVVLLGPPSAGKSTLFNALLSQARAVTHANPGTTRDALVEPLDLPHGQRCLLIDLPGLDLDDPTHDAAVAAAHTADVILHVHALDAADDVSPPLTPLRPEQPTAQLFVHTKADLARMAPTPLPPGRLAVSAHTHAGLNTLRDTLAHTLRELTANPASGAIDLLARHDAALHGAALALDESLQTFDPHDPILADAELTAAALRNALDHLTTLVGRVSPDDLIGEVFARFCVGK